MIARRQFSKPNEGSGILSSMSVFERYYSDQMFFVPADIRVNSLNSHSKLTVLSPQTKTKPHDLTLISTQNANRLLEMSDKQGKANKLTGAVMLGKPTYNAQTLLELHCCWFG